MNILKDKRAINLTAYIEIIGLVVILIGVFNIILSQTNKMYGNSFKNPISDNNTDQILVDFEKTANDRIQANSANENVLSQITSGFGAVIDGAVGMIKLVWNIIVGFFNRNTGVLPNIARNLNLGQSGTFAIGVLISIMVIGLILMLLTINQLRKQ